MVAVALCGSSDVVACVCVVGGGDERAGGRRGGSAEGGGGGRAAAAPPGARRSLARRRPHRRTRQPGRYTFFFVLALSCFICLHTTFSFLKFKFLLRWILSSGVNLY